MPTNTPTNTPVPTNTPTNTPVPTNTPTNTPVPTNTPTNTPVPTNTPTNTPVPTNTPTNTPVPTNTPTNTPVPTNTPTNTPVPTNTPTNTPVPTNTPTNTPVPTNTPTNTPVPTNTPTNTPVPTNTPTNTPVPTNTPTNTPVPTNTPTNTPVPTNTPTNTPVPTNTPTNTPVPTNTPTNTPTATNTISAQGSITPLPTNTSTNTPTITATPTATFTPGGAQIDGIAKDTGSGQFGPGNAFTLGNLWLCKPLGVANAQLPPAGSSGAGEPVCGTYNLAEVAQAPKDLDTCNDDDDGDGKPCAGDPTKPRAPWQSAGDGCLNVAEDYIPGQTAVDCDTGQGGINGTGEKPEGLGAFEFQVKFDDKLFQSPTFDCAVAPDGQQAVLGSTGRSIQTQVSVITENWVMLGCISKNPQSPLQIVPGSDISGNPAILGTLTLQAQPDLLSRMRPAKDNGVATNLLDENCELADTLGKPYNDALGTYGNNEAPSGGLVPDCKDAALTIRMLEGDLNLDCVVDVRDDQTAAFRYGQFFGQLQYNRFYDLEPNIAPDFDIDIKDVQTVFGRNGSSCASPVPAQPPQASVPDP